MDWPLVDDYKQNIVYIPVQIMWIIIDDRLFLDKNETGLLVGFFCAFFNVQKESNSNHCI